MPLPNIVALIGIVAIFAGFMLVLAWGERQTRAVSITPTKRK